jgi:Ca-activated chloride channel family protein
MQYREVQSSPLFRLRALWAFAAAFALCAAVLPPARGQQQTASAQTAGGGRPRRAVTTTHAAPAQPTPTPRTSVTTTPTTTSVKPAPTPAPSPAAGQQGAPGAAGPRLQTTPGYKEGEVTTTPTPDPAGQEVDEDELVRVDTSEIKLNVRVVDRLNRPVNDVRREDFRVFEDGVAQTIESFTKEEVPVSYGIVIDNSGSLRNQINQVIEASKTIVNSNRAGDETFLVRFVSSDEIKIMQDWTTSKTDLGDSLDQLYVEGGQTAILDAVYLSAEHAAAHKKGNELEDKRRRALILVTDGEDRNSFYKQEQLFDRLREEDVQIYVIGFVNELDREGGFIRKSQRERAVKLLDRLAKETGGRAFYPTSLSELPQIAEDITRDLRTQYVISYNPTNKARNGSFRAVRVAVADAAGRDKRIAITRAGYTAPRAGSAPETAAPRNDTLDRTSPSVKRP